MNPLGPILVACVVSVTLVTLFLLSIVRMALKHHIDKSERDDEFGR